MGAKISTLFKSFVFGVLVTTCFWAYNANWVDNLHTPHEVLYVRDKPQLQPLMDGQPLTIEHIVNWTQAFKGVADPLEIECVAKNMYFEARSEGTAGVYAVTNVVFNRMNSQKFPNTACEVIEQAKYSTWWLKEKGKLVPLKNACQFSWFCDGKSDEIKDVKSYNDYLDLSRYMIVQKGSILDITDGATFYHADYVKPKWRLSKHRTVVVGRHIFYKE